MTVLGSHTISEIADLANLTTWRTQNVGRVLAANIDKANREDPSLSADYDAWIARWTPTRYTVQAALLAAKLGNALIGPDLITNEPLWRTVSELAQPAVEGRGYGPKDIAGLQQRVQAIANIDWTERPKLSGWDLDMGALRTTQEIKRGGTAVIEGGKEAAVSFLDANKGTIALTVVGGLAGLYVARRLKLL